MRACVDLRPSLRPACELAALAALLATVSFFWPRSPNQATPGAVSATEAAAAAASPFSVSLDEVRRDPRFQNTLWIDARTSAAFAAGHIPGALRLTESEWEQLLPAVLDRWSPGGVIVVYCDSASCHTSAHVAARLRRDLAADSVYSLAGGWEAWRSTP